MTFVARAAARRTSWSDCLTSGSLALALSFGKAVVVPRLGCAAEMVTEDGGFLNITLQGTNRERTERTLAALVMNSARTTFMRFLAREYPHLVEGYEQLYTGKYAPKPFVAELQGFVTSLQAHVFGLAWFEQKRDAQGQISFVRHMIMDDLGTAKENAGGVVFSQVHGTTYTDMNGDGIPDFIAGKRYLAHNATYLDPYPYGPPVLYWFRTVRDPKAPGGARFVPELIDRLYSFSRVREANVLIFANSDAASGVRNVLKAKASGLEVGPILMGMGNRAHIVTPSITARGLRRPFSGPRPPPPSLDAMTPDAGVDDTIDTAHSGLRLWSLARRRLKRA